MKNKLMIVAVSLGAFTALQFAVPAQAQLSNMMQNMPGMSGITGASAVPSVTSASPTNLAGLLQYCVQNNYLGGASSSSASSVKDSLLNKFTGSSSAPSSDAAFLSGSDGVLQTGNGQTATLGGTGLKGEATQQVCSMVLSHSKSLL